MKLALVTLLAVGLGIAAGVGTTWVEYLQAPDQLRADYFRYDSEAPLPPVQSGPELFVENAKFNEDPPVAFHDFGVMQLGATQSHTFVIRNRGDEMLTVRLVKTTCKCTTPSLAAGESVDIAPGMSHELTLEWTPKDLATSFRQSAELRSNDVRRSNFNLVIEGQVRQTMRAEPPVVIFSEMPSDESRSFSFSVYSYSDEEVRYETYEMLNKATEDKFSVESRPLTKEEMRREPGLKGGFSVTITAHPGLPLGPIRQAIRVKTNIHDGGMDVPIEGNVVGHVTFRAPHEKFNRLTNELTLGIINSSQGRSAVVQMFVTGERQGDVPPTIEDTEPPDVLRATIGKPTLTSASLTIYPVTIDVPPNSRPVTLLGGETGRLGRIRIRTNAGESGVMKLYVRFAVAE